MFFWFIGTAWVAVWFVFRDERFDYRWLAVGSVLPDIVDGVTGGAWVVHSVTASVVLMTAIMLLTQGKRAHRRSRLAVPIGTFMHLVFDGAFSYTRQFWWPFSGLSFGDAPLPSFDRLAIAPVMEIAGLVLLGWMWRTHGLGQEAARRRFITTGELHQVVQGGKLLLAP